MALEINGQFNRFVDFANEARQKGKMSTIARIGDHIDGTGALAGCMITKAKHDRLSALWRSDANERANNDTRTLFKQTVINIFVNYIHSVHEGTVAAPSPEDIGRPTAGRTITAGVKLKLEDTAFNKYARLGETKTYNKYVDGKYVDIQIDITKADVSKAKEVDNDDTVKNKPEEMVRALGEYFRIPNDIMCEASYKVELNN